MNHSTLKKFATKARTDLMEQIGKRLKYVLTADSVPLREQAAVVRQLRRSVKRVGEAALIEQVAYTWFNRLAALRYLDARGWHPFGCRVLTPASESETQPEFLKLTRSGALPEQLKSHTNPTRLDDLLDGRIPSADPQAEVYRHLVLAACRFYHSLLPSLFEKLDDETELLLPDDLLTPTSVSEAFRANISDKDCSEVEILGWLYQFYISEKKDAVMSRKKAVPSEDIPAVTQLFTPHWIVRYLVENSLGRLWLRSRPNSRLKEHMPYYVAEPSEASGEGREVPAASSDLFAKASPKVEALAKEASLIVSTPEEVKLLDPACGSGHMLTYAFDLLVKIYEEEGHAPSEIPEKILTHNLFGLEICPRAAQLAQFALLCKAREQSRTAFRRPVQPQVMCLANVVITSEEMQGWSEAAGVKLSQTELSQVHQFRENTETFGSLIQPVLGVKELVAFRDKIGEQVPEGDLLVQNTHRKLRLVLDQAEMLSQRYQVVVANPPYMGGGAMTLTLKNFAKSEYAASKADLGTMFIERALALALVNGFAGMITMQGWMFLSRYESLREKLFKEKAVVTMAHLGARAFESIGGEVVQTTAFILLNSPRRYYIGRYFRLTEGRGEAEKRNQFCEIISGLDTTRESRVSGSDFEMIPGAPVAYWVSQAFRSLFQDHEPLGALASVRQGLATSDNNRFVRSWHEVEMAKIGFGCENRAAALSTGLRWFPFNKGGSFRRWAGNNDLVVNWENDGAEIKESIVTKYPYLNGNPDFVAKNPSYYFRAGLTWSALSSGLFSLRKHDQGTIFADKGQALFSNRQAEEASIFAMLNSKVTTSFLEALSPTLDFNVGYIAKVPVIIGQPKGIDELEFLARADWDNFETSWDFRDLPLLRSGDWEVEPGQPGGTWKGGTLAESWTNYSAYCAAAINRMQELETENNRLWIDAYGLQDELTPEVPEEEITLARADKKKDMAAFLSYAVGCMMGRFSLDKPGLILADAGDTVENYLSKVGKPLDKLQFQPDKDAIIPVLEGEWFEDDIVARTREFLRATFGPETLQENIRFIEESLGKDLRKYFFNDFYKDHLQTYKKRPIYWLVQSPNKSFQALIYLHRYNRDTFNLLLNDYLREFQNKLRNRLEHLKEILASESTSARDKNAATKEQAKIEKALPELADWERDVILPIAQQRLEIDLDDGVKQNYPKFGAALARIPGVS